MDPLQWINDNGRLSEALSAAESRAQRAEAEAKEWEARAELAARLVTDGPYAKDAARLMDLRLRESDLEERAQRAEERLAVWERWEDEASPEDEAIEAAFPTRSGRHECYAEAMRLVGARRSKGALVALVNWLLVRVALAAEAEEGASQCADHAQSQARSAEERLAVAVGALREIEDLADGAEAEDFELTDIMCRARAALAEVDREGKA